MKIILIVSLFAQIVAVFIAIFQIRKSPGIAWIFIAMALVLMGVQRLLSLSGYSPGNIMPEITGLGISILMLLGVLLCPAIFKEHAKNIVYLKAQQDIDRAILSSLSHKGIMNAVVDKLLQITRPDAIGIYIFDKGGRKLDILKAHNLRASFQEKVVTNDNELIKAVVKTKKPLIIEKISDNDALDSVSMLRQEGYTGYMSAPIITRGSVPMGVLALYSKRPIKCAKRDIEFIHSIGHQIGIALDREQFIKRIQEMNFESVLALVQAIEIRDPYTRGHSLEVASLSVKIAREMNFSEREIELVKFAGLLHDVGKIAVPESVLQKPSSLSEEEWAIIKAHPRKSAMIIEPIKALCDVSNWILHHHERWDGSGYPERLKAEHIPVQARILAVGDTYSAMIGDRPYRKGLAEQEVKKELERVSGTQLDPKIVSLFLKLNLEEFEKISKGGFLK